MKNLKKLIPPIPKFPKFPSKPENIAPDQVEPSSSPVTGMPDAIKQIIDQVSGYAKMGGMSQTDLEDMIRNFPIDQYRDHNGKITCPVSKEFRDQLKSRFIG